MWNQVEIREWIWIQSESVMDLDHINKPDFGQLFGQNLSVLKIWDLQNCLFLWIWWFLLWYSYRYRNRWKQNFHENKKYIYIYAPKHSLRLNLICETCVISHSLLPVLFVIPGSAIHYLFLFSVPYWCTRETSDFYF